MLMGLDSPTTGTIRYQGNDLAGMDRGHRRRFRRDVQMVMQDPYTSLDPRMTAEQILAEPFEIHPEAARGKSIRALVGDLLEMVGLQRDHARRYPHEFSGGQRQRIGIARALALRPRIVICDEPVSALDVSIQAQIMNLMTDLQSEFGLSYVFIAHDLSVIRQVADRIAVMYLGRIAEEGSSDEIFARPDHPYTQALLSAAPLPDPSMREQRRRIILQGDLPSPADPPSGCRFRTRCWMAQEICAAEVPELLATPDIPAGDLKLDVADSSPSLTHRAACHFADHPNHSTKDEDV
jgi:oligopeptide transport system ATP-binding protein